MKIAVLLLVSFFFCAIGHGQETSDDYFIWRSDRKLTYDDFRLIRIEANQDTAFTKADTGINAKRMEVTYIDSNGKTIDTVLEDLNFFVSTGFEFGFKQPIFRESDTQAASAVAILPMYYRVGDQVMYHVYAAFYPDQSFIRLKTKEVLIHEQIHFDICELYARKLKQYFQTELNKVNFKAIESVITGNDKACMKMQLQFDTEQKTDYVTHGNNTRSNTLWKKKIRDQLDALKLFASPDASIVDGMVTLK